MLTIFAVEFSSVAQENNKVVYHILSDAEVDKALKEADLPKKDEDREE